MKRKFAFLLFTMVLTHACVFSQNHGHVDVIPGQTIVNQGQSFSVKVRVEIAPGSSLDAAEVHLNFNKDAIQVTSIAPSAGNPFTIPVVPLQSIAVINGAGHLHYGAGAFGPSTTSFDFLDITFSVLPAAVAPDSVQLNFTSFAGHTTDLQRSGITALDSVENGVVYINPLGCTTPTATIANTGTCNGQAFDLVLSNATGATDWNLIINGTTYNDISVGETITTITPPTQNIWPTVDPGASPGNDGQAVEVGIKFTSDINGLVKGVRFFRPPGAGTFTGYLYKVSSSLPEPTPLAMVTFPTGPANQWQSALFTAPVQITANTTYLVTYHSTNFNYWVTDNYFTSSGFTNGHLTAIAEGVDGSNGVYDHQVSGGTYPVNTFLSANYWVDPVFTPGEFSYQLTSVTDNDGCVNIGSPLQTLSVTSPACSPLPVTLLDLSATPQGKNVVLSWTTSSEINNKGFEIQRSADNVLWEGLGFVNGAGTSAIPHSYTYTDNDLFPQRYYYRLKQVDNDANYKFSMTVTVLLTGKGEYSLKQNYPNPFGNETSIQYTVPETGKVKLTVFDVNGRTVKVLVNETRQAGTHAINFYTNKLQPGLYYYKMEAGSFSEVKKMVIQ